MMEKPLSKKAFVLACQLWNGGGNPLPGYRIEDNPNAGGKELIARGVLNEGPINHIVRVPWDWEDYAEVEWNEEKGGYGFYAYPDFEWEPVSAEEMQSWVVDTEQVGRHIQAMIGIDAATPVRPLVDDVLWELGGIWTGRQKATIFMTRKPDRVEYFDRMFDGLKERVGKAPGIVLCWVKPEMRLPDLPGGHRLLGLNDILLEQDGVSALDHEIIQGVLKGATPSKKSGPVMHSADFSSVTVNGREFIFTGVKQRQVLEIWLFRLKRP